MPENWKTYILGDICELRKDSISSKKFNNEAYLGLEHIGQGTFLLEGIGNASDVSSNKYQFISGDILYGKIRPYFKKVYRPNFSGICSTDMLIFNTQNEKVVRQDFLYHLIKTQEFTDRATETSSGTKMPRADWNSLSQVEYEFPPLPEQQAIANILSALDDKIENNLAMNKTLEDMAMALYKNWFVDFGPFQDGKFIDSELGPIPEGWEVKGLLEIVDLLTGGTPKTKVEEYWNGDIKWISAKDLGNSGSIYTIQTERTITLKGIEKSAAKVLPEDSTVIVARGSVGKMGMLANAMAINQSCFGLYPKNEYSPGIIYLLVCKLVDRFQRISYGSVFDTITTSAFSTTQIICPPKTIVTEIALMIDPIFKKIKENTFENQTLAKQRDTLLPKLISGEVRLAAFEEEITAAL